MFKREFATLVETLPVGSAVLMMFGEIDCRVNEGILKAHKGSSSKLRSSVSSLVASYVDHVQGVLAGKDIKPMFYGVPAPFIDGLGLSATKADAICQVIAFYNEELQLKCRESGFVYLDIYAVTEDDNGRASGKSHLDNYHIAPTEFLSCITNANC